MVLDTSDPLPGPEPTGPPCCCCWMVGWPSGGWPLLPPPPPPPPPPAWSAGEPHVDSDWLAGLGTWPLSPSLLLISRRKEPISLMIHLKAIVVIEFSPVWIWIDAKRIIQTKSLDLNLWMGHFAAFKWNHLRAVSRYKRVEFHVWFVVQTQQLKNLTNAIRSQVTMDGLFLTGIETEYRACLYELKRRPEHVFNAFFLN